MLDAPAGRRPTYVAPDLRWLRDDPADEALSLEALTAAVAAVHEARGRRAVAPTSTRLRTAAGDLLERMLDR